MGSSPSACGASACWCAIDVPQTLLTTADEMIE
jgi:hypothetical protein